jgi:hypothetical protein
MFVVKTLADRGTLIEQCPLLGSENQLLRTVLEAQVLSAAAEDIFIMIDLNDVGGWKLCQNFLGPRMVPNRFFYIDM